MNAVVEGLLFVSGEEGLTVKDIANIIEKKEEEVLFLLDELKSKYSQVDSGIELCKFGDYYKLVTKKEHKDYYQKMIREEIKETLTPASLEVLAIIAYNQPMTRSQIDEIRGISSSHLVRKLLNKALIEEKGKADTLGKPSLFGTTNKFLDYLGLNTIADLPIIEEIEIKDENGEDLFSSKYKEI